MSDETLQYVRAPLTAGRDLAPEVQAMTRPMASAWRAAGVDPGLVEVTAELLARVAAELGDDGARWEHLEPALAELDLPAPVRAWLQEALNVERTKTDIAALAVHLIDIAEMMALALYVPELPRLAAKSDRTGDAARSVGVARHLRG